MPTPIELSLTSLLPTVSPLPDELVNLATSLLAQSRTKATTLKPEEEIGRTYACSHIACQRLGHWLALDIAKPTPPVNPKVYSKLHTYLNSVLRTQTTPRRRAAGTAQARDAPSSARVNAQLKDVKAAANERVASNAAPATVELSKSVSKTTTPRSRKRKAEAQKDDVHGTPSRLHKATNVDSSITVDSERPPEPADSSGDDEESVSPVKRPAKTPLRRKEKQGGEAVDDLGPAGLLPGLGTMFQPAIDWLSDERRDDYANWKQTILRQVMLIEQKC